MDIIVLRSGFLQGEIINAVDNITWIERYRKNGEFTIQTTPDSNLQNLIPIGSLISHTNTREVMIVETHAISEDLEEKTATLTIKGRSFETFYEDRMAVANNFGATNPVTDEAYKYDLLADWSWNHAIELMGDHGVTGSTILNGQDAIPLLVPYEVGLNGLWEPGANFGKLERVIKRGNVYERLLELLEYSDLGIRTERPILDLEYLGLVVHGGVDKSATITFSHLAGDIKSAEYVWSRIGRKNGGLVVGKYTSKVIRPAGVSGLDVQLMVIDATDFEDKYTETPTSNYDYIDRVLTARGMEVLNAQNGANIMSADISSTTPHKYRRDYNIGDFVRVVGNYGINQVMRVTEYVEIKENLETVGYPTLSTI